MSDKIETAIEILSEKTSKADVRPHHWITGGDDAGPSYCPECGKKELSLKQKLFPERGEDELFLDGGYDWPEEETSRSCETCGALLLYVLINMKSELEGSEEYMSSFEQMESREAFELTRLFEAAQYEPEYSDRVEKLAELIIKSEALAIKKT